MIGRQLTERLENSREDDMNKKELLVPLYLKNGQAVTGLENEIPWMDGDAVRLASVYSNAGADGIVLFDLSEGDAEHDVSIGLIKEITRVVDIPVYGGGNVRRMEDVKKLIYAGCRKVFLNYSKPENVELTQEVSARFGKEKILACLYTEEDADMARMQMESLGGVLLLDEFLDISDLLNHTGEENSSFVVYLPLGQFCKEAASIVLGAEFVSGVYAEAFMEQAFEMMELKHLLKENGIEVNTYESDLGWDEIKTNESGLLPVVVQDYKTQEVLMAAYMNQEAFEATIRTGRMTYWSRSRQELWVKGLTSGHFQYVKELCIDCDNDTLLAKVAQVGAACHTGSRSCFYRSIMKKEYDETNPLKVFEDVFAVIQDRKLHPKEGSYTNYLFDKGIDKILKKVGEEATEIVIAAKNPDPEEIKYEISDFLYHVMVLMAEKGVTWEDITRELAQR